MKRTTVAFALLSAIVPSITEAAEQTVRLAVENMTCVTCPIIVKRSLAAVPGVAQVEVSMAEESAVVTFDDAQTTVDKLVQATANAGYPSRPLQ